MNNRDPVPGYMRLMKAIPDAVGHSLAHFVLSMICTTVGSNERVANVDANVPLLSSDALVIVRSLPSSWLHAECDRSWWLKSRAEYRTATSCHQAGPSSSRILCRDVFFLDMANNSPLIRCIIK